MEREGYRALKEWFTRHRSGATSGGAQAREELLSLDPSSLSRWFETFFLESDAAAREELLNWVPELLPLRAADFLRGVVSSAETRLGEKKAALDQLRRLGGSLGTAAESELETAWDFVTTSFPGGELWPPGSEGEWDAAWEGLQAVGCRYRAASVRELLERCPERALSFLEFALQRAHTVPEEVLAPLAESPSEGAARLLLLAYRKAGNKALRKTIKKLNHKRRVRGQPACDFEEAAPAKAAVWAPPTPPRPVGLLSLSESPDSRMVWVIRHRPPKGMVVLGGFLHDLKGLVQFFLLEMSSREAERFQDSLRKHAEMTVVETDPAYLAFLLEEAARTGVPEDEQEAQAYQSCRPLLRELVPGGPPAAPIYGVFHGPELESASGDSLRESGGLLKLPDLKSWQLEPDRLLPYLEKLQEISASRIIVHPLQKRERCQCFYRDTAREIFTDPAYRTVWRRRVEDMAWVLYRKGSVSEARRLCEVGRRLQDPAFDVSRIGFLVLLVEKPLEELLRRQQTEDREKPSLIIKP